MSVPYGPRLMTAVSSPNWICRRSGPVILEKSSRFPYGELLKREVPHSSS